MSGHRRPLGPGSYTPLVTPFAEGEIDYDAFDASVDRQVRSGSHGVVVTGTSGEPTSLSAAERAALYLRAVAVADGRIPVIAATGSPDQHGTLALTTAAEKSGADAVMVVAPAFVKPSQAGLVEHFRTVASSTELPVLLYNIPGRAGISIEADTVKRIVDACPNVVGVKHASADLDYVTDLLLSLGADFQLFCGLESFSYPFLALGGCGLMNAVGNLLPGRVAALCEAAQRDDHHEALQIHRELFAINRAVFFETNPVPLKAMLSLWGAGSAEVRPPLSQLDATTAERVAAVLRDYEERHSGAADAARAAAVRA
jgi:4-hydroxy-tetrahydrodipicolinate synthase